LNCFCAVIAPGTARSGSRGKAHRIHTRYERRGVSRSLGIVAPNPPRGGFGSGSADFARQLWWERRLRTGFFPPELFGEPAWDLILAALTLEAQGNPLRLNKAHLSACVPLSAAQKRVRDLMGLGILQAQPIKPGHRFRQLTLTAAARSNLERLLEELWFHRVSGPRISERGKDTSDRRGTLRATVEALSDCRRQLDEAEAWQAGAHLSQAISILEKDT
jgi:hypothetical protein